MFYLFPPIQQVLLYLTVCTKVLEQHYIFLMDLNINVILQHTYYIW